MLNKKNDKKQKEKKKKERKKERKIKKKEEEITPVRILLSQNQTTVKSKRGYLATCRFFHQLELEKIFILLMNFA